MTSSPEPHRPERPPRRWRRWLPLLAVVGLLAWAGSGVYVVQPDERGVVRMFGRLVAADVLPGVHYAPPRPIGRVDRPKTTQIRRFTIGLDPQTKSQIEAGDMGVILASPASDVLSGDTNILKVTLAVQYQVTDPVKYVLRTVEPDEVVKRAAKAVMVETLARLPVDQLLTTAKAELRDATLRRAGELLDAYETGISIISANVQSVEPPQAVVASFNDVTSARYDQQRVIERARNYAATVIRSANGKAFETLQAARDYATQRTARARGQADSFLKRHAEYARAPQVTRERLLLSTLQDVLPKVRKFIVDEHGGKSPVQLRLYDSDRPPAGP